MREMMQRLNVVKYATSKEQKEDLMKKGFALVENPGGSPDVGQDQGNGFQPGSDQKKSGKKTKTEGKGQQKPVQEPGQGADGTSNQESQTEAVQAGDGNA